MISPMWYHDAPWCDDGPIGGRPRGKTKWKGTPMALVVWHPESGCVWCGERVRERRESWRGGVPRREGGGDWVEKGSDPRKDETYHYAKASLFSTAPPVAINHHHNATVRLSLFRELFILFCPTGITTQRVHLLRRTLRTDISMDEFWDHTRVFKKMDNNNNERDQKKKKK